MLELNGECLLLDQLASVVWGQEPVKLSASATERMAESRATIDEIVRTGKVVYGVNTGFGKLSNKVIPSDQTAQLQLNLVRSHACGVGDPLAIPEVRAMMLLRANVLAKGFSGIRLEPVQLLVELLNRGVTPVVPSRGSVGASGDLAPLAHMCLVLIGEGEAFFDGERLSGLEALHRAGLEPVSLQAKEGLALLNGTQALTGVGSLALIQSGRLLSAANLAGIMSLEALLGTPAAFDDRIHQVREQQGQILIAKRLRDLCEGSQLRESHREGDTRVQDAYCLRCMPQVHGAVFDTLLHASTIVERETGAATDNPLVFAKEGDVISGGNFHGAPVGYVLDFAAIAMTDLLSISERRLDRMLSPDLSEEVPGGHLPAFLSQTAGISSGYMMAQVTAAALLCEARIYASPASVDNVPTSGGKEDHVSMGMTAALKLKKVVDLCAKGLAIELMAAADALEYRREFQPAEPVTRAIRAIRTFVPPMREDYALGPYIDRLGEALLQGEIVP